MAVVFLSFMLIGMALPVLPLHVHKVLGFGPFVVGLVAGGQFTAALISRLWAGRLSDTRGAKYAVFLGLIAAGMAGMFYLASVLVLKFSLLSVALILIGRTLLGGLGMIGFANSARLAMSGAAICGAGFSLVFPSLGLEAVKRAPAESRGLAMGTYNAFLDLTLGFGSPALGWLGGSAGLGSIFIGSAVAALLAVPIALRLLSRLTMGDEVTCDSAFPEADICRCHLGKGD